MPGHWYTELFDIAADQYGFVTTTDASMVGAPDGTLVDLRRHGHVRRVAHGVYRFVSIPSTPFDEYMQAVLWSRRLGILSHDSALLLWELCDVSPTKIHLTVPKHARLRRSTPAIYEVHARDLDPADVTNLEGMQLVTPRRAIEDGVERHLDGRLIEQAISSARARGLVRPVDLASIIDGPEAR